MNGDLGQTLESFEECGVVVLRGFFAEPKVTKLNAEATRLWEGQGALVPQNLRVGLRTSADGSVSLDRLDPVVDISSVFQELNQDPGLVRIAEAILGSPVAALKEKLIYKNPGTSGFGLHRDAPYLDFCGVPPEKIISCAVALDSATVEKGAIEFFPGLLYDALEAPSNEERDILDSAVTGKTSLMAELDPGDLVIFSSLVPHRSRRNVGTESRRTYIITYVPAEYSQSRERYYAERYRQQQVERQGSVPGPFFVQ